MNDKYDVLVVGGGPSGSIAAKTLAGAGAKVSLVEKDFKYIKLCGGATASKSFEEFNIPEKSIVRKIRSISTVSPSGSHIDTLLESGYIAMVKRGEFDRSLRKQAAEAGADLMEGEFKTLEQGRGKTYVTVAEKGKEKKMSADFLIAADGISSRVAKAAGLESLPCIYTIQEEIDMHNADDLKGLGSCEFWFGMSHAQSCYSWVFPKKDCVDIGTGSTNGKLLKGLMKKFKIRRGIEGTGKQRIYRLPVKWRNSLVKKNILFVGDAAGLVMPCSFEGIYYAMKSGEMAAGAIVKNNLKDYEKQWNKTFRRQFKLMERLKKYFLRNDKTIEQMCRLHKSRQMQRAGIRLLFEKDTSLTGFFSYLNFYKKIFSRVVD